MPSRVPPSRLGVAGVLQNISNTMRRMAPGGGSGSAANVSSVRDNRSRSSILQPASVATANWHQTVVTTSVAIALAGTDYTVATLTFSSISGASYEILATMPGINSAQAANSYQIALKQGASTRDTRFVTPSTVGNVRIGHVLRHAYVGSGSSVTFTLVVTEVVSAGTHDGNAYAQSFAPIILTAHKVS